MTDDEWAQGQLRQGLQAVQDVATKPLHAEIERLREVVKYLRAILPPERWADDARKMADAALGTTVQPPPVPSMKCFRICEHCNKEYELPSNSVGIWNFLNCPNCGERDDPWLRVGKVAADQPDSAT